ncbi:MAG: 50S ribosomal protein L18 [Armatimonadetes bacterium 55-13]|nr:50S ribosomal protein L18 [Armatimonadota bacterium]OJU64091.1 MAG: 50S ribosomal protein L18 [Armatimonadetes bacterium 55-13]
MSIKTTAQLRKARHVRLRKRISGTTERPRLAVFRSLHHIYAQIIDDSTGTTLAAASSQEKGLEVTGNAEGAKKIGIALAERAKAKGINAVVFDRGGFRYHGRVASLADGAREGGLEF